MAKTCAELTFYRDKQSHKIKEKENKRLLYRKKNTDLVSWDVDKGQNVKINGNGTSWWDDFLIRRKTTIVERIEMIYALRTIQFF